MHSHAHSGASAHGDHSHHGHHGHSHAGHSHGGHSHSHFDERMTAILGVSVAATFGLVATELIAGYGAHSIALISDAIHNLTDVPMLVISWLAARWAQRPPTAEKTYGYHRAGVLAAFVNATLLTVVAGFVIYESSTRFFHPTEIHTSVMLWVSVVALVVNGGITLSVHGGRSDLSVRTVWIHNLGDALSNVAVFVSAIVISRTHLYWLDPLIGIVIGIMVLWSVIGILRETGHILLEGLPREMKLEDVAGTILRVEGVQEVHDVHIWTLGTNLNALSCHVCIPDMHMDASEKVLKNIRESLNQSFGITHTTIQFERAGLPQQAGLYMPKPARQSVE